MNIKLSWFKDRLKILYFLIFIVLFLLSLDFWGWEKTNPLILGLPFWIYYLLILTLLTSLFFYLVAKNIWKDDK